ncbi:ATP-binding protein [Spirosoma montaniterrae]|uniref:PAS domain-containing sensor histidine kinase n=1 Tax=Spirosoma montaniterrae TaxID=1178516 RepID=UPI0018DE935F|nr:ATP-binding protein [Spirosoma montaniterrae]
MTIDSSSALLDGLLNHANHAICIVEGVRNAADELIDFRYVKVNPMAYVLNKRSFGDMVGRTMLELFPGMDQVNVPGTEETLFRRFVRQMHEDDKLTYEVGYHQDGFDGYYAVTASRLTNCLIISVTDVTELHRTRQEKQQADQQLREQADLFTALMRVANLGLNILDVVRDDTGQLTDLHYRHISQRVLDDTGMTIEQYRNASMRTLFPGIEHSRFWQGFQDLLRTGQPQRFEVNYKFNDCENYLDVSYVLLDERTILSSYIILNDVRQAQQRAEQQAQLMSSILQNTQANLTLLEPVYAPTGKLVNFRYIFTNDSNARITRRTVEEMTGSLFFDLFPGIITTEFYDRLLHTAQTGEPNRFLFPYHADGLQGWFDVWFTRHGNQVLFTSIDVTESYQNRQQLERANRELQRSNEHLQQFAYVASHDLQEPLRKIQSFGDLLRKQYSYGLDEQAQDILGRMQNAASRMSELVRDLLAYSRLNTPRRAFESVSLTALLNEVLTDLDLISQARKAHIVVGNLPAVPGDAGQLRQLFQNLLSNALKYTAPDRQPLIRVTSRAAQWPKLPEVVQHALPPMADNRPIWEISIHDNGIGFDEKYLDQMFQMFQRLHGRSQFEGSGMGLAICKRVVDNHSGYITARSHPDAGSTFIVYLPG